MSTEKFAVVRMKEIDLLPSWVDEKEPQESKWKERKVKNAKDAVNFLSLDFLLA